MMNILGVHLTLMLGQRVSTLASPFIVENLRSVEVTQQDQGPSGFQMTFHIGRSSVIDLLDYRLLTNDLLKPFSRVMLLVRFAITPVVLMDGIITNQQFSPGNEPGASTLTLTGEDVSVLMDLEQVQKEYVQTADDKIVDAALQKYMGDILGLPPRITQPANSQPPSQNDRVPQQANMTDRAFIQMLAQRNGHVFYLEPGPIPGTNVAYWGPPIRGGAMQPALSVNMGPDTNVDSINFTYNALAPFKISFIEAGGGDPIVSPSEGREKLVKNQAELRRTVMFGEKEPNARAHAQGQVDRSLDDVVTASGELDALRYNGLLKPRALVGLRGAGRSYDGSYYVKSVTTRLTKGQCKQSFTLTREGTGALQSTVKT
ncbi:MAG TPA: hypothetical protein VIC84_08695 [Blastocatellia bacterium]